MLIRDSREYNDQYILVDTSLQGVLVVDGRQIVVKNWHQFISSRPEMFIMVTSKITWVRLHDCEDAIIYTTP